MLQDSPPNKLRTDIAEDVRFEVALTELGNHLEFDQEDFYVKEHYHEVYLADNDEGDPADFKLTTKERKALDREIPYRMIPGHRKGMGELAEVRCRQGAEHLREPRSAEPIPRRAS